ncbi:MAG: hypothetical protein KGJ55_06375 [Gammaproteobacteria bacterium]|nr:hypothetical protein [Gammaproteobacteria bacterium]
MRAWTITAAACALLLSACGSGQSNVGKDPQISFDSLVLFDPVPASATQTAIIPFPFDGLFAGSATPTLNVPGTPPPLSDINQVDGFSTSASMFADAVGELDYSTVPQHLLIIDTATGKPLVPGTDFTVQNSLATATDPTTGQQTPIAVQRSRILVLFKRPLAPSTTYLCALTKGIKNLQGGGVIASPEFRITASATPVDQQTDPELQKLDAAQKAQLEALRSQLIHPAVAALTQLANIPADQIVLAWTFTTESTTKTLDALAQNAQPGVIQVADTTLNTQSVLGPASPGAAEIFAGLTTVPYYLQVPTQADPTAPLSGFWHADATKPDINAMFLGKIPCGAFATGAVVNGVTLKPSASTTGCFPALDPNFASVQKIPVLVTVPRAIPEPPGGWPVVIFQHGITQNRTNLFAVADGLAAAGFVGVAIDLPLHGIADPTNPFFDNQLFANTPAAGLITGERTFNLDLENNATGAPGPDGVIDPSGTYFINLQSLITSRDNNRQAVADLLTLTQTVKNLDLNRDGVPDVNPNRIRFFGHSLGAIVGTAFLGVDSDVGAAVLANPGGGEAKLLDASAAFGPPISAGLAQAGVLQGSDDYETFLRFAQTLVDPADPINYAVAARAKHPIDMIEVIGDTVVPNAAPTTCPPDLLLATIFSPQALVTACPAVTTPVGSQTVTLQDVTIEPGALSGTDPLWATMGLEVAGPLTPPVTTPDIKLGANLGFVVQFLGAGANHGSVLNPTNDAAVTQEMQREAANFLAADGQCLPIGGNCQ